MNLILIILASIILFSQFFLDFLVDYLITSKKIKKENSHKTKITIGIIILFIGLMTVWITFYNQKIDKRQEESKHNKEFASQQSRFDNLDSINTELNIELKLRNEDLKIIRNQNDSLKSQILNLSSKQEQFLVISQFSAQEVSKSRVALENMGYKQISRGISQYDKIEMVKILKNYKNSKIILTTILGNSEAFLFSEQIKEVFETAGWKVDGINQAAYNNPLVGVFIGVKSQRYPSRVDNIFSAFKILNIIAKGNLNTNLQNDDIELIIGTK